MSSRVDHPFHYNAGEIEVIDAIESWGLGDGFNLGNVIKYIARAKHKSEEYEDLQKAAWYLLRHMLTIGKEKGILAPNAEMIDVVELMLRGDSNC